MSPRMKEANRFPFYALPLALLLLAGALVGGCVADEGDNGDFRVCRETCTATACLDNEVWCYDECGNAHHRVAVCLGGCEDGLCLEADGDADTDEETEGRALYDSCESNSDCESNWCYPMPGDPKVRFCTTGCRLEGCLNAEVGDCRSSRGADYVEPEGGCGLGACCYLMEVESTTRNACEGGGGRSRFFGVCAYPAFVQ